MGRTGRKEQERDPPRTSAAWSGYLTGVIMVTILVLKRPDYLIIAVRNIGGTEYEESKGRV